MSSRGGSCVGSSRRCLRVAIAAALAITFAGSAAAGRASEPEISVPQAAVSQGDVFLVTIKQLPPGASVDGTWQGSGLGFVAVSATESLALVGVDFGTPPGSYALTVRVRVPSARPVTWQRSVEVAAKDFGVQHLTLPKGMVHFNRPTLARVRREAALLSALWPKRTPEAYWRGGFVAPVPGQTGTPFGIARVINGEPRNAHSGIDLRAALGEEVRATNRGRVALVGDFFFHGRAVVLDHGMGVYSMYFHLSQVNVAVGDLVESGGVVGLAGATGRATGPHLHWAVRLAGARVDPLALVRATSDALVLSGGVANRAK
jgi:murein DD-endopeptidase MepM/ murein hydrolase activator NlpD